MAALPASPEECGDVDSPHYGIFDVTPCDACTAPSVAGAAVVVVVVGVEVDVPVYGCTPPEYVEELVDRTPSYFW